MPITDDYGQGFEALDYSDTPDLKVLGEGLLAIVGQSVMRFTNAAARNAALSGITEAGMLAFLASEAELTVYDGSAWVVVAAGTASWTNVTLASGFTHNGNSNGNFQYRRVNLFGEPTLMFRGAVNVSYSGSTIPNSGVVTGTALPTASRPTTLRTINVPCSDVSSDRISLKMDIQTDGHLKIFGTGAGTTPPWIGFNGTFVSL